MLYSVQAARFLAACMVLVVHSFNFSFGASTETHAEQILYVTRLGNAGVHIFFVISGFIIVYANRDAFGAPGAIVPFLIRRFLRIFPIFWILALINIPIRFLIGAPLPDSAEDYALALLLYPGHSSDLIFVGWSLSYEIFFYLISGVLLVFNLARAMVLMTVIFLSLAVFGFLGFGKSLDGGFWTNALLAEFVFGAWIAFLAIRGHRLSKGLAVTTLVTGLALLLAGLALDYTQYPRALIWGVPSALFIYGCVNLELSGALPKGIAKLKTLGDASYVLYLLHAVLIPLIAFLVVPAGQLSFVISIGLVVCFALVSIVASVWIYLWIERPMLRWFSRRRRVRNYFSPNL